MNFSGTKCDECGRIKGDANHWHQVGVYTWPSVAGGMHTLMLLGEPMEPPSIAGDDYEVHDLCGEACFYKHIGKLLRLNPATVEVEE